MRHPPSTKHPNRLWGPLSLMSNDTDAHFPRDEAAEVGNSSLHLVLNSRMRGALSLIPPYFCMASWLIKHKDNLQFCLCLFRG
jgi:hypothetical protein